MPWIWLLKYCRSRSEVNRTEILEICCGERIGQINMTRSHAYAKRKVMQPTISRWVYSVVAYMYNGREPLRHVSGGPDLTKQKICRKTTRIGPSQQRKQIDLDGSRGSRFKVAPPCPKKSRYSPLTIMTMTSII